MPDSFTRGRVEKLGEQAYQHQEKIRAEALRTTNEIEIKKQQHRVAMSTMKENTAQRIENLQNQRVQRLQTVIDQSNKDAKDGFALLKKEISFREAELQKAHDQKNQQHADGKKESTKFSEDQQKSQQNYVHSNLKTFLDAKVAKLNADYEQEKAVNTKSDKNFEAEFEMMREVGLQRIEQLNMLLSEQNKKIESDKQNLLKFEITKLNLVKVALQQSKDQCVVICFPPKHHDEIKKEMRRNMENLRSHLYNLSSQIIGIERKLAESKDGIEKLREPMIKVKQSNTIATEAVTNYLRHKKLSSSEAEACETAFLTSMGSLLNNIDTIVMLSSGRENLNEPRHFAIDL